MRRTRLVKVKALNLGAPLGSKHVGLFGRLYSFSCCGDADTSALPAYSETATSGSGTFALNCAERTVTATRSELGAKSDKATAVTGGVLTLKARGTWAHDWNSDFAASTTFPGLARRELHGRW